MIGLLSIVPSWLWAVLVAGLSLVSCTQQVRLEHSQTRVAELRTAIATAEARAAEQAAEMLQKVTEAQNESKKREALLRASADSARSELDGLRGDIDHMRDQLAGATASAATERAAAVGAVLQQCAARYSDLAAKADRHVNDIRTLIEAWPR